MEKIPSLWDGRIKALIIDHVVVWAFLLVISYAGVLLVADPTSPVGIVFFSGVLYIPLFFLYKIGMEGYYGQTIGKSACRITVRQADGTRCSWRASILRNFLLVVDYLPALYALGLYVASGSAMHQRVGDRIAETVVVNQR